MFTKLWTMKKKDVKVSKTLSWVAYFSTLLLVLSVSSEPIYGSSANGSQNNSCNCVVFRIDDIQDFWTSEAQIPLMDYFIDRGLNVTLGLELDYLGNDSNLVNKISEGYGAGLFELAIHDSNRAIYPDLSEDEQRTHLQRANAKIQNMFGNKSNVFIPPLNQFNNDTLGVLSQLGITIFSSSVERELDFNGGKNILIAKNVTNVEAPPTAYSVSNPSPSSGLTLNSTSDLDEDTSSRLYHLPTAIEFEGYGNDTWIKVPVNKILEKTSQGIEDYGYGVINLHPTNFLVGNDTESNRPIDVNDFNDLSLIVNTLSHRGIAILSMADIVEKYG